MEPVPLTEDLAASPADADLYLPLPPENPIENTAGKSTHSYGFVLNTS